MKYKSNIVPQIQDPPIHKRSNQIFDELDQLVNSFSMVNHKRKKPTYYTPEKSQLFTNNNQTISSMENNNSTIAPIQPFENGGQGIGKPQDSLKKISEGVSSSSPLTFHNKINTTRVNINDNISSNTNNNNENFTPISFKKSSKNTKYYQPIINNNNNGKKDNTPPHSALSKDYEINLDELDLEGFFNDSPKMINICNNNNYYPTSENKLQQFPLSIIIKHTKLNPVQENCFELLYNTDHNSLITAPTGSGKTLLFEIAISRVIAQNYSIRDNIFLNKKFKIIYLAPIKSLCQEKFFEWKLKYSQNPLDMRVVEATGDSEFINMTQLMSANIILTTPERFDVLSRKWKENSQFISSICLLLIDEIHLLNEETRGATIEAIIARMKLLSSLSQFKSALLEQHRTIALSATIPNIPEVAEFLQVDNKGLKIFGEEYRPVKIERIVLGYQCGKNKNEYMFEKSLDYRLAEVIQRFAEGKPTLVFCNTQKGTVNAAKQLIADISKVTSMVMSNQQEKMKLDALCNRLMNKQLGSIVKYGIAFHNAGLSLSDRQAIEDNFKNGLIRVICTTSTLAQGVNLPARLVIIKSTNCYRGAKVGYMEYNKMEIDQMVGRAGRPQYDTKGIAVIMTEKDKVDKFTELSSTMIESHLKDNIVEHINAEISTETIIGIQSAVKWIKNTFMYIRMKNNPSQFGIRPKFKKTLIETIDDFLKEMCTKIFKDLEEISLITLENNRTKPRKLCKKMSQNYVQYDTMKTISKMYGYTNEFIEEHMINILSNSKEFMKYSSKLEERKALNILNKDESTVKYKVKGAVDSFNKKAYLLIQAELGGINIDHWELRRQQTEIVQSSCRIMNCLREYYKHVDDSKGFIASIVLKKSLTQGIWADSEMIMKQLPKIGEKLAKCFVRAGINTFEKLIKENPRKIESVCGKNSPFGNILIDIVKSIPILTIKHELVKAYSNVFKLQMVINLPWEKYVQDDFDPYTCYHIVVVENEEKRIKFKKKIRPNSMNKNLFFSVSPLPNKSFPLSIYIICDKFIGLDRVLMINNANDNEGTIIPMNYNGQKSILQFLNKKGQIKSTISSNISNDIDDEELTQMIQNEFAKDQNNDDNSNNNRNIDVPTTEFTLGKNKKKVKKEKAKKKNNDYYTITTITNTNNNSNNNDMNNNSFDSSQTNSNTSSMINTLTKNNNTNNISINSNNNTGNDLLGLIENMKTEHKNKTIQHKKINPKLKDIAKYELMTTALSKNSSSLSLTSDALCSTQNLLTTLKEKGKPLEMSLSFLDKWEKDNNDKSFEGKLNFNIIEEKPSKEAKNYTTSLFNFDDLLM